MSKLSRKNHDDYLFPNYAPLALMPEQAKGARLWDTDQKEYVDFAAGVAVSSLGHCHPELIKVLQEQANKFWHVSNLLTTRPAIELAKQLVEVSFADKVIFSNSGAEANEAALKLARRFAVDHHGADKHEIIAFDNSFHGRTFFTVCVGGQAKYSDGFGPKPQGIKHLPFNDADALAATISEKTCAVILEPIQGEGGVVPATKEFLHKARQLCDEYGALLIFDEIQTGLMRTGNLFCYQGLEVEPDILTLAKGLGGGFPIGAMLARQQVAESFSVGVHGTTFGGNPMACAVASKVIELVNIEEMQQGVKHNSELLKNGLHQLNKEHPFFVEMRGSGLLIGCELSEAFAQRANDVVAAALEQGLLMLVAGPNVARFAPPLVATERDIEEGLYRLGLALSSFEPLS